MKRSRWWVLAPLTVSIIGVGVLSWAPWASGAPTSAGSCTGSRAYGTPNPSPLTDQSSAGAISVVIARDPTTKQPIGGECTGLVLPSNQPAPPVTLHRKAMTGKFTGIGGCAVGTAAQGVDATAAAAYPANGILTMTMVETNSAGLPYSLKAYLTLVPPADPVGAPDVYGLEGVVIKGLSQGALVHGSVWEAPVDAKGAVDNLAAAGCIDGTPNNVQIRKILIGDGKSPFGSIASGFTFEFPSS